MISRLVTISDAPIFEKTVQRCNCLFDSHPVACLDVWQDLYSMYYPEGMKARLSPVQPIEPNRILATTQDLNQGPLSPQSRVLTTMLSLYWRNFSWLHSLMPPILWDGVFLTRPSQSFMLFHRNLRQNSNWNPDFAWTCCSCCSWNNVISIQFRSVSSRHINHHHHHRCLNVFFFQR